MKGLKLALDQNLIQYHPLQCCVFLFLWIMDRGLWTIVCRSLKCVNGLDHNLVILFTAVVLCVIVVDHGLLVVDYGSWIMDRVSWIIVSMSSIGILKYILS